MRYGESHLTCTHNTTSIQNINSFVNQIMLMSPVATPNDRRKFKSYCSASPTKPPPGGRGRGRGGLVAVRGQYSVFYAVDME